MAVGASPSRSPCGGGAGGGKTIEALSATLFSVTPDVGMALSSVWGSPVAGYPDCALASQRIGWFVRGSTGR